MTEPYSADYAAGVRAGMERAAEIVSAFGEDERFKVPEGSLIHQETPAGAYQAGIADASTWAAADLRAALSAPTPPAGPGMDDYFGAHILNGELGKIDGRSIGPGHVVLTEARYRVLLAALRRIDHPPGMEGRVERAARALCHGDPDDTALTGHAHWQAWTSDARAALTAAGLPEALADVEGYKAAWLSSDAAADRWLEKWVATAEVERLKARVSELEEAGRFMADWPDGFPETTPLAGAMGMISFPIERVQRFATVLQRAALAPAPAKPDGRMPNPRFCILCANGNDLPNGERCPVCARTGGLPPGAGFPAVAAFPHEHMPGPPGSEDACAMCGKPSAAHPVWKDGLDV